MLDFKLSFASFRIGYLASKNEMEFAMYFDTILV